jgi:monoamine oxidase
VISQRLAANAGAYYANGWMGFIDGAIESGLKVSREVKEHHWAQA